MKILSTSDIHQWGTKWGDLVKSVKQENPDITIVSGDIFPKDGSILSQIAWGKKNLIKYAEQIKSAGSDLVFILGNDDNWEIGPLLEQKHNEGLWYYVHDKVVGIKGYSFAGCAWVPDYPFTYKHWVAPDTNKNARVCELQLGDPIDIQDGKYVEYAEPNWEMCLKNRKSIENRLNDLAIQVPDMKRSIWLIHSPPYSSGLDMTARGEAVGSQAVRDFIVKYQPFITIHGHIHESPEKTGRWKLQMGDTLAIQAGQVGSRLHYVIIELDDGTIKEVKHSIYGVGQ